LKATNGTNYVQFDFNGVCLGTPEPWTSKDGVTTLELNLSGQYNSTLANWLKAESKNSVSVMP